MPNEYPAGDPRNIWQHQPTEKSKMSTDVLRYKAQQQFQRARSQAQGAIALGLVLCALFAWSSFRADDLLPRIGWAVASLWCAWFAYHAYRWIWPGPLAADAPVGPSLEFYRRELERRRDYFRHTWLRSGLPFGFLGLAIVIVPPIIRHPSLGPNALPFFVLLTGWFIAYFYLRAKKRRELQQEIEELQAFERDVR
jgi:hypothetical protein